MFVLKSMIHNLVSVLIICLPIMLIILLSLPWLRRLKNRHVLLLIGAVSCGNFLCYLTLHLPSANEYKFLILATVPIGLIGGVSFYGLRERWGRFVAVTIILPFLFPVYVDMVRKAHRLEEYPKIIVEHARFDECVDPERNDIYQWLRTKTPVESVVIDSQFLASLISQRHFLIAFHLRQEGEKELKDTPGFVTMDFYLRAILAYDREKIARRKSLMRRIYSASRKIQPR